jgi:transposase
LRQEVRRYLLAESGKHSAWEWLRQIPFIGPIRAALILAILQTPGRIRTNRQPWTYIGFGIETHSSAEHRYVDGKLQRSKKQISIRGLNRNHNHDLKNLYKSAANIAAAKAGPFQEFYDARVAKANRMKRFVAKFSHSQPDQCAILNRRPESPEGIRN